jgi:flavin-dependent dehydrogenase
MAARLYYEVPSDEADRFDYMCLAFEHDLLPGYGWVFPGPDRVFNVGVAVFLDAHRKPASTNLRTLFDLFVTTFPPAAGLASRSRVLTPLQGAPLRTALTGARLARPGLLVVGEAAGLTYSFSGEGIGKAMESGLIAADLVASALGSEDGDPGRLADAYAARVADQFANRFHACQVAQAWLSRPVLANLLARRARRGRYARAHLEGLLMETTDPRALFSATGFLRMLVG